MSKLKTLGCSVWVVVTVVTVVTAVTNLCIYFAIHNDASLIKEKLFKYPKTKYLNDFNDKIDTTFTKPRFRFLPEYKNPCWFEPVPNDDDIIVKEPGKMGDLRFDFTNFINYDLVKRYFERKRISVGSNPQRLSCLPYFLLIGVHKSGTTDLFFRILKHPQIAGPPLKETHWWSIYQYSGRNITFQQYVLFFEKASIQMESYVEHINGADYHPMVTGEGSPTTCWLARHWDQYPGNENVMEPVITNAHLVRELSPDVKLIVILRNPVERLLSNYLFFYPNESKSAEIFHEQVIHAITLYTDCMARYSIRRCFYNNTLAAKTKLHFSAGMYVVFMKDWFDVFPRNRFLIIRTEEYSKQPICTLNKIYNFLELEKLPNEDIKRIAKRKIINKGRNSITPYKETLQMLDEFYAPFNRELAYILNDSKFLFGEKQ